MTPQLCHLLLEALRDDTAQQDRTCSWREKSPGIEASDNIIPSQGLARYQDRQLHAIP